MGSSSSKIASKAAGAASRRQYPSTSSLLNSTTSTSRSPPSHNAQSPFAKISASSQVHPDPATNPPLDQKSEHIDLDGRDPHFGSALRKIGVAKPVSETKPHEDAFPTSSQPMSSGQNIFPSSMNNPAMLLVQAREKFGNQFEAEIDGRGRAGFPGRTLLSAKEIKEVFTLRDDVARAPQQIEKELRLKTGILDQLAPKGVAANA
ncbi:uncharacterized protein A1O9_01134 [Exophiala aquamarina CBS 119918]|uniref:Helix-turn-helix domain-containing protein n=1 Tax=Exophiala aquamarina CBS 119918 TaxID=1182545 RepID=A0A072PUX6_9EURO|nr:uncharacterized protein A1O9_01134 [Exophiala aquamarina CBS 119918]KEF63158.1 hypothetical protein A1O9_01134 [Exophiala aquamarina CBS 119918]